MQARAQSMRRTRVRERIAVSLAVLTLAALTLGALTGCGSADAPGPSTTTGETAVGSEAAGSGEANPLVSDGPPSEALRRELDEVLEFTLRGRHLSLEEHAAWQILHGVLAYQQEFRVRNADGELIPVVDHLLHGGQIKGWTTEPGDWLDEEKTRRGLRAILEEGSKAGQGHADQWLAVLAQCDLPADQEILVNGQTYTMRDFVGQVLWDVPRNVKREYSWTLIGLTTYLPTDYTWTASDGREWSIRKLVGIETEQDLDSSACGGSHRLIGMTMALNRHLAQGGELDGEWKRADEIIQDAVREARAYQNPDGSFSTNYFRRGGQSADLAQNLGSTGHTLEFLTLAMTDEQLREPWVQRAVVNLCDVFRRTRDFPLECGALYHAAHGLVLYRHRVFGPRTYGPEDATGAAAAASAETPAEQPAAKQASKPAAPGK